MKILVLGGCGIQGRAAVHDLTKNNEVESIIVADADTRNIELIRGVSDLSKVRVEQIDAADRRCLDTLYPQVDVVIDLLPRAFLEGVVTAAIRNRVPLVNTNYADPIAGLDDAAKSAGIAIMPECGLDPGIDLVLYGEAVRQLDEITLINSYCGGFPEKSACDNPLNYKVSWIWEGVLSATKRDSCIIRDGKIIDIPGADQHNEEFVHQIDFPGLGLLEAIPNGNAKAFTDRINVTETIRETGRYSLRWPGWSAFWRPLKQLGFLSEAPVKALPFPVSPYQMMDKLIGPQLQYRDGEKDLVAMLNRFEGKIGEKRVRLTSQVFIERDLETGLMAMSMGVGYPSAIVAVMIARGEIKKTGVLTPTTDIPFEIFREGLEKRGIEIKQILETVE